MKPLAQTILRALLGQGYFPRELPDVFTTADFGEHCSDILFEWESAKLFTIKQSKDYGRIDGKYLRGRYGYKKLNYADPEIVSKPKKSYERRNIHITHPIPQALLAREIAENWRQLHKILSRRKYSEDEIVVSTRFARSIKGALTPENSSI